LYRVGGRVGHISKKSSLFWVLKYLHYIVTIFQATGGVVIKHQARQERKRSYNCLGGKMDAKSSHKKKI